MMPAVVFIGFRAADMVEWIMWVGERTREWSLQAVREPLNKYTAQGVSVALMVMLVGTVWQLVGALTLGGVSWPSGDSIGRSLNGKRMRVKLSIA